MVKIRHGVKTLRFERKPKSFYAIQSYYLPHHLFTHSSQPTLHCEESETISNSLAIAKAF